MHPSKSVLSVRVLAAALVLGVGVATFAGPGKAHAVTRHRIGRHTALSVKTGVLRTAQDADPPEVAIGERLFLETRFAQYFFAHQDGNVNHPLKAGDPVVARLALSAGGSIPGPFAGQSMNCRGCHFVDDVAGQQTNTYGDYSRRSAVPARTDGATRTARNAPPLVDAQLERDVPFFLHFDAEFATAEDLVASTLTGRNFGWLAGERATAVAHIGRVVREDDGSDDLGRSYGGPLSVVLAGVDPGIPSDFLLPPAYRLDVATAADEEILAGISRLIAAYLRSLTFQQDDAGFFSGSPYDVFLVKNGLPRGPDPGESDRDYSRRLASAVSALGDPAWVSDADGSLAEHDQPFVFGPDELKGLKIFLREPPDGFDEDPRLSVARSGNCAACHAAPRFTDFGFHNTGVSQEEYDDIHGDGTFARLFIPDLAARAAKPEVYLPPSSSRPQALGVFRQAPSVSRPGQADLGLWNVFANPDIPVPQAGIPVALHMEGQGPDRILQAAIARFKTPTLRDLGQSAPYMHSGRKRELEDAVALYLTMSARARQGRVRNAAPELSAIFLTEDDVAPLAAFLRSLNEDYN